MSSREKKRKKRSLKPSPSPESTSILSLPDDLVVSCLARVSRLDYRNLYLVSKSFRSILASPELYKTRTLLGRTENCLYVCLHFPDEANPRWFTLYRKPNHSTKKTKKKESSCNLLAPVPILNSPPLELSGFVPIDCNIYAISSGIEDSPCSNVWLLDCRTHTWLQAPRMRLAQSNELMYLAGSSEKSESLNFVEVYNTKTQTWKPALPEDPNFKFGNLEGKIYMKSDKDFLAIKPKYWIGEVVELDTDSGKESICVIENITYLYDEPSGMFVWKIFNTNGAVFRRLAGLEGLPKFARYSDVRLVNCGGKLLVLWDKYVRASGQKKKMIWCAEISLEKRNDEEIWGKVVWFDAVLTVPKSYKFVCAVAATV
ncbi:F-box/kelch-repeat protein [Cardamine amara subsp. amara]|uniref:F-box/kelch-repeat protein n=1 Tax=Cardamine amara subsp. amara TaxID=228776 RepID=A0ABD1A555_CARAN